MSNIENLRKERLERIKKEGGMKFILKYGLAFSIIFGLFIFFISKPPVPSYILIALIFMGGGVFGICMWFFMMWQYNKLQHLQ